MLIIGIDKISFTARFNRLEYTIKYSAISAIKTVLIECPDGYEYPG